MEFIRATFTDNFFMFHGEGYIEMILDERFLRKHIRIWFSDDQGTDLVFETTKLKDTSIFIPLQSKDIKIDLERFKDAFKVEEVSA
jgi:hypothetical protein